MSLPRKKARMTETIIEVEPQAFLNQARESLAIKQKLEKSGEHNLDIDQNIRCIRAILAMNQEIWNRCKLSVNENSSKDAGLVSLMMFTRYGYEKVKAYTRTENDKKLWFITRARRTEEWFCVESLVRLPAELNPNKMFQPPFSKDDSGVAAKFIDYDLFFENSLSLHDTILKPFLATLKDHLGAVQVCLGKIDEWLMVPHNNRDFLEKTFGMNLIIPNIVDGADVQYLLKKSHIYGTHNTTFKISKKSQQIQLEKFLDFVQTAEQDFVGKIRATEVRGVVTLAPPIIHSSKGAADRKHRRSY
jgi:hypothetical protein